MAHTGDLEEQRKHRRFQAPYGAVAALKYQSRSKIGLITDLSKGGLAFSYVGHNINYKNIPQKDFEIDIIYGTKGFYLDKVTCKIILDNLMSDQNSSSLLPTNKCRIQFVKLTSFQKSQLAFFIDNFTNDSPNDISPLK